VARLAVDRAYQGHGIRSALVRDSVHGILQAADCIGIRDILASHRQNWTWTRELALALPAAPAIHLG
jgi:GNAT superfamily N-acetyltransferase